MISDEFGRVACTDVRVDRASRQRKTFTIDDLVPSVRLRGVLLPIIVDREFNLIAGERRLATSIFLGLPDIPYRFFDDLDQTEQKIIELEENLRRVNLSWQDEAAAIHQLYQLYVERDPEITVERFAAVVGLGERAVYEKLDMGNALAAGDEAIKNADTVANARTIMTRRRSREADETLNRVLEVENEPVPVEPSAPLPEGAPPPAPRPRVIPPADFNIRQGDAFEFFATEQERRFNLLHCDFPYGVVLNEQAGQASFEGGGYDSSPEIYWRLCEALAAGWDNIMYPSAHVIFWISMKFYTETIDFFERKVPQLKFDRTPLIWHKTDNRGVLPDANRGGRNTYEAALFGATGDRFIVKPVAKSYGAPTNKAGSIHTNEKPEPMLSHFLSMVVDQHTRALDPTCGSGSAIRVVEALGAEAGLGLEHNPEFAARAQQRLASARNLRVLSANRQALEVPDADAG